MNLNSPLFDRIRIRPSCDEPQREAREPACERTGCAASGLYRAPKGRGREGQYWRFCLDHVREYNASYNYFSGMSDEAVARYQKDAVTGHRPTWKMGMNGVSDRMQGAETPIDPFEVMREFGAGAQARSDRPAPETRTIRNAERKAFDTLGLETDAPALEIKARFKELVKRHHPDAN